MSIALENRATVFEERFRELVQTYNIHQSRGAQWIEAQRIARLCSVELVKLYNGHIGQDAECAFFYWAKEKKLCCDLVKSEEYVGSKKVKNPYPSTYRRILEHLSFEKYFKIASSILDPPRSPILRREPVTSLRKI